MRTGLVGQHHSQRALRPGRVLHQHLVSLQQPGAMHGTACGKVKNARQAVLRKLKTIGHSTASASGTTMNCAAVPYD